MEFAFIAPQAMWYYKLQGVHIQQNYFPSPPIVTVRTFNSCTKCVDSPGIMHDRMPDCNPVSGVLMHGIPQNWMKLWIASYVCHWCPWLIFLTYNPWAFCTTRHWQTSGRLVQELNGCTVEEKTENTDNAKQGGSWLALNHNHVR